MSYFSVVQNLYPRFHNLSAIMRKHFTFLYAEEKVKTVFTPAPFVSFHSGYSLRNHLVRAKVYHLLGSYYYEDREILH